jgi:hypothetical protein
MKNALLWDVTPCGCCKNCHFGGIYCLHHQGGKNQLPRNNVSSNKQLKHTAWTILAVTGNWSTLRNVLQLLVIANIVPSSLILSTLMVKVICSSEMAVLTRATWRHITEDGILHVNIDHHDNLKSWNRLVCRYWRVGFTLCKEQDSSF